MDEAWFDSAAVFESDWSDEDFQSLPDGMLASYICFRVLHSVSLNSNIFVQMFSPLVALMALRQLALFLSQILPTQIVFVASSRSLPLEILSTHQQAMLCVILSVK